MDKYGLRGKKSGRMVGFSESSNGDDAEFCNETTVTLSIDEPSIWLVDDPQQAEWVRCNTTGWYNSDYATPNHNFKPDELETVKIHIDAEPIDVELPSILEVYEEIYKSEPKTLEQTKKLIKSGHYTSYSWNDLCDMRKLLEL
jgi:hypothetical protein